MKTYESILDDEEVVATFRIDSKVTGADALIGFLWNQCAILLFLFLAANAIVFFWSYVLRLSADKVPETTRAGSK